MITLYGNFSPKACNIGRKRDGLELIECEEYLHTTPKNTKQKYSSFIIKRQI